MTFLALLVSTDEGNAAALTPILAGFGMIVRSCDPTAAVTELTTQKFDIVLVDFDDPQRAALILQNLHLASPRGGPVSVALLAEPDAVRSAFSAGANFVLFKPISTQQAESSLRAAIALIKRERRRSLRVPVQVSVQLRVANGLDIEGILLDLSEDGLEVLSSQPLSPSASLELEFALPSGGIHVQAQGMVVWANANGQAGVHFHDLSEETRSTLRDWVASHARRYSLEEADTETPCVLTDLSQGGCYVETPSPYPERSGVSLRFKVRHLEVKAEGMVRVMHPGYGMGVEFASYTPQQQEEVADFIRLLMDQPGTSPELLVAPHALANPAEPHNGSSPEPPLHDALLNLLRGHEAYNQEEFLRELHSQRHSTVVQS